MKKEIVFSVKAETAAFDRTVEALQRKMRDITGGPDLERQQMMTRTRLAASGMGAPLNEADRRRADQQDRQARQELEKFIKDQVAQQDKLNKAYAVRNQQMKEMQEMQKKVAAGSKEELELKEKLLRLEESRKRLGDTIQAKDQSINEANAARLGSLAQSGSMMDRAKARMIGLSQFAGSNPQIFGGVAAGAIAGAANSGLEAARYVVGADNRIASAQGAAVTGYTGDSVGNLMSGQNFRNIAFARQRTTALDASSRQADKERVIDNAKLLLPLAVPALMLATGAALTATGIGAGVGLPVMGAALSKTAVLGAGALAGGVAAGGPMAYLDRLTGEYEANKRQRDAQIYQQRYQAEMQKNPIMQMATERMMQNAGGDMSAQRMLGLSDQGYFKAGGFLDSNQFTRGTLLNNAGAIMGAGGSTRAGRGLSSFSAGLARDYDLTNAGGIIGQLSGAMGSAQATESATIKLLSEGVRLGLNKSEYAAEQREFLQVAAAAVVRSGATSDAGAGLVAGNLSRFVAGDSMAAMRGAGTASQLMNSLTGDVSGPRGAIQASAMMRNPIFKGVDQFALSSLMDMSVDQILAGGAQVQGAYAQAKKNNPGLTLEQFQQAAISAKNQAVDAMGPADEERDRVTGAFGGKDKFAAAFKSGDAGAVAASGPIMDRLAATITGFNDMDEMTKRSFVQRYAQGDLSLTDIQSEAKAAMASGKRGPSGRMVDTMEGANAAGDNSARRMMNQVMEDLRKNFEGGSKAVNEFTDNLIKANQKMQAAILSGDAAAIDRARANLQNAAGALSPEAPRAGAQDPGTK